MTDQNEAQQEAETVTQQEAMPTSEQKTSDQVETTGTTERESPVKEADLELPADAKERTQQQFEKLKSQLAEEREKRTRLERVFTQHSQPQAYNQQLPEWYDPDTQSVDVYKLQQREVQLQQKIDTLENRLGGLTRQEEIKQEQEAYNAYPELNPNSGDFDDRFQRQLISYMATEFAEGRNPTMKQAADDIVALAEKRAQKVAKEAQKQGAQRALESLSPKEQAALEATGRSDRRLPQEDLEAIRARTRQGGRAGLEAAMKRLSRIPTVGT